MTLLQLECEGIAKRQGWQALPFKVIPKSQHVAFINGYYSFIIDFTQPSNTDGLERFDANFYHVTTVDEFKEVFKDERRLMKEKFETERRKFY